MTTFKNVCLVDSYHDIILDPVIKRTQQRTKMHRSQKREFNIVMSGQFRTLAMFFREAPFSVWSLTLKFGSLGKSKVWRHRTKLPLVWLSSGSNDSESDIILPKLHSSKLLQIQKKIYSIEKWFQGFFLNLLWPE